MKKTIMLLMCCIFLITCTSCGLFGPQEYTCDVEEVTSVQIIKLDRRIKEEYRFEYTILSQISDYKTFVKQLTDLDHSVNWGEPSIMELGIIVVRIDYRNGNFDLIHPNAQLFNRSGINHNGYFFFEEDQFNALISGYLVE